jgi:hypothetical protein
LKILENSKSTSALAQIKEKKYYEKYLVENNLTIISRIREEEDMEVEPSKDDLKQSEKDFRSIDKIKKELANLKQKDKDDKKKKK